MPSVEVVLLNLLVIERVLKYTFSVMRWVRNRRVPPSQPSASTSLREQQLNQWQQQLEAWEMSLEERKTQSRSSKPKLKPTSERSWMEL